MQTHQRLSSVDCDEEASGEGAPGRGGVGSGGQGGGQGGRSGRAGGRGDLRSDPRSDSRAEGRVEGAGGDGFDDDLAARRAAADEARGDSLVIT